MGYITYIYMIEQIQTIRIWWKIIITKTIGFMKQLNVKYFPIIKIDAESVCQTYNLF